MDESTLPKNIGKQIRFYRKQAHLSQRDIADKLLISETSVSNWERGVFVPTQDNMVEIAKILNVPISKFYGTEKYTVNERMFCEKHMEKHILDKMGRDSFPMSIAALKYVKDRNRNRTRIGKDNVPYIYHPLLMACQAFAMGIATDTIIAACLLHDVLEYGSPVSDLTAIGINDVVKNACMKMVRSDTNVEHYFESIALDPVACLVKCLSRCSNLSTMNTVTDATHRKRCLAETEKYYGGLLKVLKAVPEWNDAAWLLSYQIQSLCEAHKLLG